MSRSNHNDEPKWIRRQMSITDHPVIYSETAIGLWPVASPKYRYAENPFMQWIARHIDMNEMHNAYLRGEIARDDYMQFYRDSGVDLEHFEFMFKKEIKAIAKKIKGKKKR